MPHYALSITWISLVQQEAFLSEAISAKPDCIPFTEMQGVPFLGWPHFIMDIQIYLDCDA